MRCLLGHVRPHSHYRGPTRPPARRGRGAPSAFGHGGGPQSRARSPCGSWPHGCRHPEHGRP
eukprot:9866667-Prorocentrum_lima.AAC.1